MPRSTKRLARIRDTFFWIGVAFATAAISIVAASNTEWGSRLERQTVPVSWILAGVAIVALLVAELVNSAAVSTPEVTPAVTGPRPVTDPRPMEPEAPQPPPAAEPALGKPA